LETKLNWNRIASNLFDCCWQSSPKRTLLLSNLDTDLTRIDNFLGLLDH
jgi:hypothetical protein